MKLGVSEPQNQGINAENGCLGLADVYNELAGADTIVPAALNLDDKVAIHRELNGIVEQRFAWIRWIRGIGPILHANLVAAGE